MFTYGKPCRVRKSPFPFEKPWVVLNHPAGTMAFATWREAIGYATSGYYLMNAAVN